MCRLLCTCNLALLPFSLCTLAVCTFLTTYLIAVYQHNIYPYFPSVSETTDHSPQKNIFGQLFNICSFMALITFTIRYFQLRHDADWNERDRPFVLKLNKASFAAGIGGAVGASLTANFPSSDSEVVHMTGAVMVFGCGVLYCCLQTIISLNMNRCGMNTKFLFSVRLCISAIGFILLVSHFILKKFANDNWHAKVAQNHTHSSKDFWIPGDGGYLPHVASALSEWLLMLLFMFFLVTFFGEFRTLRIRLSLSRYNDNPIPLSISDDEQMRAPLLL